MAGSVFGPLVVRNSAVIVGRHMSEREYLQLRAAEEFERATEAGDEKAAAIHAALAGEYARRSELAKFIKRR